MRRVMAFGITSLVLGICSIHAGEESKGKAKQFSVDSLFSIDVPMDGYSWAEADGQEVNGTKARRFILTKKGSTTRLVLTIELRTAKDGPPRSAAVKGHYNGLMESLRKGGFTELKTSRPDVDPPIPDNVLFVASGKTPGGVAVHFQSLTRFGRNIFIFQAMGESKEDVEAFMKVADSMKELPLPISK